MQPLHTWISLLFGILLLIATGSGLVLSVNNLGEQLQNVSNNTENLAEVVGRVAQRLPDIQRIERSPNGQLRVSTSEQQLQLDPQSAEILHSATETPLISWVQRLHREMLLGETGRWLSGLTALALLVLLYSGSLLLARRLGGWRRLWQPIRGQGMRHWHLLVARWALPVLAILGAAGLYLFATDQGLISDGQESSLDYPQGQYSAPAQAPENLPALRHLQLQELRELEFPSSPEKNLYRLRTADGEGFINASSGQWISYQPQNFTAWLYESAYLLHSGADSLLWTLVLSSACLGLLFLIGSGLYVWWRRKRQSPALSEQTPAEEAESILLVGSQGGTSWHYAKQLQAQLKAQGWRVHCASMNSLQAHYPRAKHLLLLTSTYGHGQAPDSARNFLQRLEKYPLAKDLPVAVLGFGDTQFEDFCGYALTLEQALQKRGLTPLLPLHCIDRGDLTKLNAWAEQLGQRLGVRLLFSPPINEPPLRLQLLSRELYAAPEEATAAILRFAVPQAGGQPLHFAPGDLLAIYPAPGQPARFYSIASSSEDGYLEICVRKHAQGLCSSLLHGLPLGQYIEGFIQPHPEFRPTAGSHPVVLVGAGTGLAPLVGFVRQNTQQRPIHLYWGGRQAHNDFLYATELRQYLQDGRLSHLRLAFSAAAQPMYVQDRLGQDSAELLELLEKGAQVLVCGSRKMAAGVRSLLEPILQQLGSSVEQLRQQERYREDVY